MNKRCKRFLTLSLAVVMLLSSCVTPDSGVTDTTDSTGLSTEAPTDPVTEAPNEVPTETPTETPTEPSTEAPTTPAEKTGCGSVIGFSAGALLAAAAVAVALKKKD